MSGRTNHRTPTWVKALVAIAVVLVVMVVIMVLTGVHDGPARHFGERPDPSYAIGRA